MANGRTVSFVAAAACMAVFGRLAAAAPASGDADPSAVAARIVPLVNALRRDHGLRPVSPQPMLRAAAQGFADFMARSDRYGHTADGREPAQRARAKGYDDCMVSENIAFEFSSAGFSTDDLAHRFAQGWAQSPPHRRNILDPLAVDTGTGVARSAQSGRYYAVQMFGRPQALRMRFRVTNRTRGPVRYELGTQSFELPAHATYAHARCDAATLVVHSPDNSTEPAVQPVDGAHYVIEPAGHGYRIARRAHPAARPR